MAVSLAVLLDSVDSGFNKKTMLSSTWFFSFLLLLSPIDAAHSPVRSHARRSLTLVKRELQQRQSSGDPLAGLLSVYTTSYLTSHSLF